MSIAHDIGIPETGAPMTQKTKWLLAGIGVLLLAMFAFAAAGPYLAINGIRDVVANGEYGGLPRYVDFDKLRESIRPQIQQRIAGSIVGRMGRSDASSMVSGVTAVISEPAIDAMVSPIGIATLLRSTALVKQVSGKAVPGKRLETYDPLKGARTGFESASVFTATVASAEGKPMVFEFTRNGLSWKLTGIRLPD
ncbi:DUF2939 domain-containing protein [Thermomonas sp. HDW16]|uniref:DUF2939 domain-containing protein n=1 Tax=Thermomonas sp. HDW16 TaxID=2714945 RepID=UPI00140AC49E|nr:DUF2939 domain-containing protein [Thermomonas sp. HDW16]QIL20696.1 DUF2939 domain-containing protein [Thermomonas sp. HDW16]